MNVDSSHIGAIATSGGFSALATAFIVQSIGAIIPWLCVMTAIIFCDLFAAWWRCYRMNESIRFSKAIRDTMAKIVIYYSFVVSACFTDVAAQMDINIARNACLLVCALEFVSIIGNLLKIRGVVISLNDIIRVVVRKKFDLTKEDADDIVK